MLRLLMERMLQVERDYGKNLSGFLEDGAKIVTLGNHTWDNREIFEFIDDAKYIGKTS